MNERMEQEIRRTIRFLQASMPEPKNRQTSVFTLLRIAASEINAWLLLGLYVGALSFGLVSVRVLSMPMLTIFCTAPMPMLLLFHRYVLACDQRMRELEATFPYSYSEMLAARSVVISCCMFGALVLLSAMLHASVGEDFLRRLEPGHDDLRMFSPDMAVPLAALKKLAPGRELEQMEAFQAAFYGEGRDVLSPEIQIQRAGVDGDAFMQALQDPGVQDAAEAEREEALDILGDFVVYPTLFLETDDGERHVLARGYADYAVVAAKLASVLDGGADAPETRPANACGLDGHCDISA